MARLELSLSPVSDILESALSGSRPSESDCLRLLESGTDHMIGAVGGALARRRFGARASFVNNIILNYTNVCVTDCKFCAFYRPPGAADSYALTLDQIRSRVRAAWESFGIRQALIQGGHNPGLGVEYYEEAFSMIRSEFPKVGVHGLSASELDMIARVERSSTREIISRLKESGLQSVPGAGAEILSDRVKGIISPKKIPSSDWLRIMREAHLEGLPTSATMMYGHVETGREIAAHFAAVRRLQEETRGFMAFIPWNFEPNNTPMQRDGEAPAPSGGADLLRVIAVSRMMFDGLINHVQSSWLTNGVGMAQLALAYGADDFGGTLMGEEVVSCTGARSTELTDERVVGAIRQMGYAADERDNFYRVVRER